MAEIHSIPQENFSLQGGTPVSSGKNEKGVLSITITPPGGLPEAVSLIKGRSPTPPSPGSPNNEARAALVERVRLRAAESAAALSEYVAPVNIFAEASSLLNQVDSLTKRIRELNEQIASIDTKLNKPHTAREQTLLEALPALKGEFQKEVANASRQLLACNALIMRDYKKLMDAQVPLTEPRYTKLREYAQPLIEKERSNAQLEERWNSLLAVGDQKATELQEMSRIIKSLGTDPKSPRGLQRQSIKNLLKQYITLKSSPEKTPKVLKKLEKTIGEMQQKYDSYMKITDEVEELPSIAESPSRQPEIIRVEDTPVGSRQEGFTVLPQSPQG